jgi:acyl-coenzyme A thioesterase PaaI-like protein
MVNWWPPYLFSGVRVLEIADDWSSARVRLRMHWYNRNYVGTHFGGSLFAMSDPFWMLLVMNTLGRETSSGTRPARSNSSHRGRAMSSPSSS